MSSDTSFGRSFSTGGHLPEQAAKSLHVIMLRPAVEISSEQDGSVGNFLTVGLMMPIRHGLSSTYLNRHILHDNKQAGYGLWLATLMPDVCVNAGCCLRNNPVVVARSHGRPEYWSDMGDMSSGPFPR